MLKHAKGNLLDMAEQGMFDIIIQGCNCQNTMGSGLAREIKSRYPNAWEADVQATKRYPTPILKLGNMSFATQIRKSFTFQIINAYTQIHYLPRGIDHFEYESFQLILRKLQAIAPDSNYGFPYIGMGLAGGDSVKIIPMIEQFSDTIEMNGGSVTLVEFG